MATRRTMTRRDHFLIVSAEFVILMIGLRETVADISCFSCNYSSTTVEVTSTCRDASSSVSTNFNCLGLLCRTTWAAYSAPSNAYRAHKCTKDGDSVPAIDECQGTTVDNKTYFVYQNQCCYSTGEVINYGTVYSITECYCQTDYCNGVTSLPTTTATTLVNSLPSAGQPLSHSATTGQLSSPGHSMNYSTAVDYGFVTTSPTDWQKNLENKLSCSSTHWVSVILTIFMSVIKMH